MRFYQSGQLVRLITAGAWAAILVFRVVGAISRHHVKDPVLFGLTIFTALAAAIPLTSYWEVKSDALVRHLLFRRTVLPYRDITLVVPYAPNGKTVGEYLQIQRSTGKPLLALIDKRAAFLEAIEQRVPSHIVQA